MLQELAEKDIATAQNYLGDVYRDGVGAAQDFEKAVMWYTKAANQGKASAQLSLGYLCETGQGALQDTGKAWGLYKNAALQDIRAAVDYLLARLNEASQNL